VPVVSVVTVELVVLLVDIPRVSSFEPMIPRTWHPPTQIPISSSRGDQAMGRSVADPSRPGPRSASGD
jgi:hypothetical protein